MKAWEDISSYSRNVPQVSNAFEFRAGTFRLVVHRHVHYPKDVWLATCYGIFDCTRLASKDAEDAKEEAMKLLGKELKTALDELKAK